jgi:hypothetical protein
VSAAAPVQHSEIAPSGTTWAAWRLEWLTPVRCRIILAALIVVGFVAHVRYLAHDCPIELSGDEAQYWDWSRQLDLSYYSKGPLVAYLIRASCAIFGETMPAVRYPALLLGAGTSIITYLLTRKLFGSERLALGAVLLNACVPMFVLGSIFMTIDPPMFFCWACATYFLAIAILVEKRWAWPLVGVFVGLGFLAKYSMFAWLPGMFLFVLANPRSHGHKSAIWGALLATVIALVFTAPVIVWNARHDWVSVKHVAHQTGATGGSLYHGDFFELILSQLGALGPVIAVLLVAAAIHAWRVRRASDDPHARAQMLLFWIGMPILLMVLASSLLAKAQVNWPAPAYFTLMILAAYYLATRMRSPQSWRRWRGAFWATVVLGIVAIPIVHDPSLLFPSIRLINRALPANKHIHPGPLLAKVVGWRTLGQHVGDELATLGPGAFVLCDDYMQTAATAFYTPGQPKTYYAGSYYLSDPKRMTQYDVWADRRLDNNPDLLGRNAVFVGKGGPLPKEVEAAFERIEKVPEFSADMRGEVVKTFKLYRGYGFKGMPRAAAKDF